MKKIIVFVSIVIAAVNFSIKVHAQDLDVQLNPSQFDNGYNVSCNAASNGTIRSIPVNGNSPYAFQWSNGATTQEISNLAAGTYTLTVIDFNNATVTREIMLTEPEALNTVVELVKQMTLTHGIGPIKTEGYIAVRQTISISI